VDTAGPADADGAFVDVGGEQLHRRRAGVQLQLIVEQHGQTIGFFARGAARGPDPDFFFLGVCGHGGADQLRHDIPLQGFESLSVTEELVTPISMSPSSALVSSGLFCRYW